MSELDPTNRRLIEILQHDARTTVADLAREVDRAESTVRERIANLERSGVVSGYRAVVNPARLGLNVHAILHAEVDWARVQDVAHSLGQIPQVTRVYLTTGDKGIEAEVYARDLRDLETVLEERVGPLGLEGLEADLVVGNLVDRRPLDLTSLDGGSTRVTTRPEEARTPRPAFTHTFTGPR